MSVEHVECDLCGYRTDNGNVVAVDDPKRMFGLAPDRGSGGGRVMFMGDGGFAMANRHVCRFCCQAICAKVAASEWIKQ